MYRERAGAPGSGLVAGILREADGAHIPADPSNVDWQAYLAWVAAGNAAAPAAAPPVATTFTGNQWALAIGDLGLAGALLAAVAAAKAGDRHRYGLIARDTVLQSDDPLLARICAHGNGALDLAALGAHALAMPR